MRALGKRRIVNSRNRKGERSKAVWRLRARAKGLRAAREAEITRMNSGLRCWTVMMIENALEFY